MEHFYRIDWKVVVNYQLVTGCFRPEAFRSAMHRLFADPAARPDYGSIIDMTECRVPLDDPSVRELANAIEEAYRERSGACAVIVDRPVFEMISLQGHRGTTAFFATKLAALAYLEIPQPRLA